MKKTFLKLTSLLLCLALAACSSTTTTTTEPTAQPTEEETAETTLSGKVVVYQPSPSGLADKLAEAFTAKTGVEVEQFQGTTGEILARL